MRSGTQRLDAPRRSGGSVARSTPAKRPPPTGPDPANALRTCNGEEEREKDTLQFARASNPRTAGGVVGLWERFRMKGTEGARDTTTDACAASVATVDEKILPPGGTPPATPATAARNSKHTGAAEGRRQGATASAAAKAEGGGGTGKVMGVVGAASCMRHLDNEDDNDFMDDTAERRPLRRIPATVAAAAVVAAAATTTTQVETDVEVVHDRATADGDEGVAAVAVHVIKLPAAPELPSWAMRVGGQPLPSALLP